MTNDSILYDFEKKSNPADWQIVDDGVMGGLSNGKFKIDADGHGMFYGHVSTANNGGFSSVRYRIQKVKATASSKIVLRIKGDGKDYQFRIKDKVNTSYSYITAFKTSGDWESVEINLKDLYPSFRGRKLNLPNYQGNSIEEIVFLIGNKKNESFQLLLDKITMIN